jgi:hypothetical protein
VIFVSGFRFARIRQSPPMAGAVVDNEVTVAVELAKTGEGVVIGVYVDGVDVTDEFETVEDTVMDDVMSVADSDYWEVEEPDEIVELLEPSPVSPPPALEELRPTDSAVAPQAPVEIQTGTQAVDNPPLGDEVVANNSPPQQQASLASPQPSPVTKSRRRIIGGIVRGPAPGEGGQDAPVREKGMGRSKSVTLIRRKKESAATVSSNGHVPFSLAASGHATYNSSTEAPWAAPWSPSKASAAPTIIFQGGSGQLARALSASAISASAMSLDVGRHSHSDAGQDFMKPPSRGLGSGGREHAAPLFQSPSVMTFTSSAPPKSAKHSITSSSPGAMSRQKGTYKIPSLSPDMHVMMTGSKRGSIASAF